MITWTVYIIVSLILLFVLYLAILGINRGVEAKSKNKVKNLVADNYTSKNISDELRKLKKLYKNKTINKKEFDSAKKKLLS